MVDDVVIRSATSAEVAAIAAFNSLNHHPRADGQPNQRIAARTRDLLDGRHPTCTVDHCLVVALGKQIVGSATAIPQTWTLGGTDLHVEMVEFVAVDRALRSRGLGRRLMNEIHAAISARGAALTAIIGRPSFYTRFGYHALPIGTADHLAPHTESLGQVHTTRTATIDDLDLVVASQPSAGLHVRRDHRTFAYELGGRHEHSVFRRDLRLVVRSGDHRTLGWYTTTPDPIRPVVDNVTAGDTTHLGDVVATIAAAHPGVTFALGPRHPASELLERTSRHDRLHVRVADPHQLLSVSPTGRLSDLTLAVDRDLWRLGPVATRVDATEDLIDHADVHLTAASFVRVVLGLADLSFVADYDADVEFRTAQAEQLLAEHLPARPVHLWPLG